MGKFSHSHHRCTSNALLVQKHLIEIINRRKQTNRINPNTYLGGLIWSIKNTGNVNCRKSWRRLIIYCDSNVYQCIGDKRSGKLWATVEAGAKKAVSRGCNDWIFNCKINIFILCIYIYIYIYIYIHTYIHTYIFFHFIKTIFKQ